MSGTKHEVTIEQELAEAVQSWLSYKNLTGLKGILTEASLAVPIGEYLSTKFATGVETEKAYPRVFGQNFSQDSSSGSKRIDFVRFKRGGNGTWAAAYESKYKIQAPQPIIDDLCRLACLRQAQDIGSPEQYFVYAGPRQKSGSLLESGIYTGNGKESVYLHLLGQKAVGEKVRIYPKRREMPAKIRKYFREFSESYKVKIPSSIVTEVVGHSFGREFGCIVWRISSAKSSPLIGHEEIVC